MDVRALTQRTAKKKHTCSFSGRDIYEGQLYWEVSYTKDGSQAHYTYRVQNEEYEQFIKEKLYMSPGFDFTEMQKDIEALGMQVDAIYTKYGNMPGFSEKYLRVTSLAHRAQ